MNLIKSEWLKLSTTKAVWWTSGLILFFAVAFAALNGVGAGLIYQSATEGDGPADVAGVVDAKSALDATGALGGMLVFGMMIIIIQAVLNVTNEYANGTAKNTLLATPTRLPVPFAKVLVYGVLAMVLTFISAVLSVWTNKFAASRIITNNDTLLEVASFGADGLWTAIGRLVLYALLSVVISTGVGYLLRSTAASIAALLLWKLVVESAVVPLVPKIRDWLPPYMPFNNIDMATMMMDTPDAPWGQVGSILYFAAFCVIFFIAGLIALKKRDA